MILNLVKLKLGFSNYSGAKYFNTPNAPYFNINSDNKNIKEIKKAKMYTFALK